VKKRQKDGANAKQQPTPNTYAHTDTHVHMRVCVCEFVRENETWLTLYVSVYEKIGVLPFCF